MKGYRIGKTLIQNFLPFRKAEFDFSLPGLTAVEGEITGVAGCGSNGSGKSALAEAPVWAITGNLLRSRCKGDDVIRIGSKGGCLVDTTLHGANTIRVVRHRGHAVHGNKVFLFIDGVDVSRGTTTQTDAAIARELGLDFTTFCNTVAFGARSDVRSFFSATDAERKQVMDRLLGLEAFERARSLASKRLNEAKVRLDELMTFQLNQGFLLEEKRDTIRALKNVHGVDKATMRAQEKAVRMEQKAVRLAKAALDAANEKLDAVAEDYRQDLRVHDREVALHDRSQREAHSSASKFRERARASLIAAEDFDSQIKSIKGLAGGDCPTCLQPVMEASVVSVVKVLAEQAESARARGKKLRRRADRIVREAASVSAPKPPDRSVVERHQRAIEKKTSALQKATASLRVAEGHLKLLVATNERASVNIGEVRAEAQRIREAIQENLAEQSDVKATISQIEFWFHAFGNAGVKSFVIESQLPEINRIATDYAQRLLGAGTKIRLRATRTLKTTSEVREEMVVDASIPGCSQTYAGASKGQRHRLDLSLILAFREVVSQRIANPFDQFFADELFDGIDEVGVDCVVDILREIAAKCPVLLVTHDVRLKSVGDRRVVVTHDGSEASIG